MKEVTIKTIGWTIFGMTFCTMFYGMFIAISVSNADIRTEHIFTINMDNETKDAMMYLADIKEHEIRQNNLFCENELLNQSKHYDNLIWQTMRMYEVENKQRSD